MGGCLPGLSNESINRSLYAMEDANRIFFPSGLNCGLPAPNLWVVSCLASPPIRGSKKICGLLSTLRTKAICLPSGLQAGCPAFSLEVS